MIEWKAIVIYLPLLVMYLIYLIKKSNRIPESEPEQESITTDTKILINELHQLTEQHTNLQQFLFDTEQNKETTYQISYKTTDNTTKTAEIIKAVDSTPYIQELTRQQIGAIENRIADIIQQLNAPVSQQVNNTLKRRKASDTSISKAVQYISRAIKKDKSGEHLKDQEEIERGVKTND